MSEKIPASVQGGQEIVVASPTTGEELGRVPACSMNQVKEAVRKAAAVQHEWARIPLQERCKKIRRLRDAIAARSEEIVNVVIAETGKPREEALIHEVAAVVVMCSWCAANAPRILRPRKLHSCLLWFHRGTVVHYVPLGVVAVISPWNAPFSIPMADVIAALVAGNAVVLKPSEWTPLTALKAKELYDNTGLPADLFQVVTGGASTGQALLGSEINKVNFTGSVAVGKKIAASCGERLMPCTLELGGKAPAIVLDDADIDRTARALVWGSFANSGQICVSVERAYVHESVYDALVERMISLTNRLRQGNPALGEVDIGSMTTADQVEIVDRLVQDALSRGAKVLTGGMRRPGPGSFYQPTLLADVRHDMPIMQEEIFGPVLPIMKLKSVEEAVKHANDSRLGLNAYVFGSSRRARELAKRVQAGSVVVNDVLSNYTMPEVPFGGVKESGLGRVHGEEGLRSMCDARAVGFDRFTVPWGELWWFPYSRRLGAAAMWLLSRASRSFGVLVR